uniref:hypothetical protein n=1 Tax=Cupriavidus gilardii TaxID=82541 RepID=UPI0024787012|nr:hypothetical protein [Cupriavidus gilardii]WDE72677.1 hypothetical protein [Cupriavidus gilardii]
MPCINEWISAEVALEHNGVTVYHAYKDDDIATPLEFWFMLDPEGTVDDDAFDARDFLERVPSGSLFKEGKTDVITLLREAIDAGLLSLDETTI